MVKQNETLKNIDSKHKRELNYRINYTMCDTFGFSEDLTEFRIWHPFTSSENFSSANCLSNFCTSIGWRVEFCSCFMWITSLPPIFTPTTIWVPYFSMNLKNHVIGLTVNNFLPFSILVYKSKVNSKLCSIMNQEKGQKVRVKEIKSKSNALKIKKIQQLS